MRLRASGLSYQAIADLLAISRQAAWAHVQAGLAELADEARAEAAELRAFELSRIDSLLSAVWEPALDGDLGAWDRALRAIEARCRVLGLACAAPLVEINLNALAGHPEHRRQPDNPAVLTAALAGMPPLSEVVGPDPFLVREPRALGSGTVEQNGVGS